MPFEIDAGADASHPHYYNEAQRAQLQRIQEILAEQSRCALQHRNVIPWTNPFAQITADLRHLLLNVPFVSKMYSELQAKRNKVAMLDQNGASAAGRRADFADEFCAMRYITQFGCSHAGSISIGNAQRKHLFELNQNDLIGNGIDYCVFVSIVLSDDYRFFTTFYFQAFSADASEHITQQVDAGTVTHVALFARRDTSAQTT